MAIMAMATDKRNNKSCYVSIIAFFTLVIALPALADEWLFTPGIGIEETYSDNVLMNVFNPQSSLVSQTNASIDTSYQSPIANFLLSAKTSYLKYNYNSDLNDDYLTLSVDGAYSFWTGGPKFIAGASIDNISRNLADNTLADLISGGTIQAEHYFSGLKYDFGNSNYTVNSSLIYSITQYEDNIANSDAYTAKIASKNGSSAQLIFWQIDASYTKRTQSNNNSNDVGENRFVDTKIGAITSISLNPFVRFYDEDVKGTSTNHNLQTTPSWGPGIRWQASSHLIVDISYNFVLDETVSDDYIDTEINWQPSGRTSLVVGYSQRFFGNSYNLNFQHKTKRLINTITYSDELEVFDRLSYDTVDLGSYWCPLNIQVESISQCSVQSQPPANINDYNLITFSDLAPVNSQVFSLNRNLAWLSKLSFARTSFAFKVSGREREALDSGVIDNYFNTSFIIERKSSARSSITFKSEFAYTNFDKENPAGSRQEDYYRTLSLSYTRQLASSLSSFFTLRHVNRDSNKEQFNYDEIRAIINITKEF
jgi:uncharacterized protein (PEP-CTERM system associated)